MIQAVAVGLVLIQMLLMSVDELVFHRRRGLGLFEVIGHPVDTAAFALAVGYLAFAQPTPEALKIFVALAVISTLIITKDEWIHKQACPPEECWLHAMLFVIHAPVLAALGALWWTEPSSLLLKLMPPLVGGWLFMQIFYWTQDYAKRRRSPANAYRQQPAPEGQ